MPLFNKGDLTHAKYGGFSTQYKEEWEVYKAILKETGVQHKTQWIDIRGNHGTHVYKSMNSHLISVCCQMHLISHHGHSNPTITGALYNL